MYKWNSFPIFMIGWKVYVRYFALTLLEIHLHSLTAQGRPTIHYTVSIDQHTIAIKAVSHNNPAIHNIVAAATAIAADVTHL